MPELTVIIPSYREEENLRLLLPRLFDVLANAEISSEVLVLDTQQPLDNTELACQEFGARYVVRQGGNSYGDAVRTGLAQTKGKYVLFMDADGSHAPEFLPRLIEQRGKFDVVVGSRYIEGGDTENSLYLIFLSKIVNVTYSFVLGLKCRDVSNSLKMYRTEQISKIKLKCSNFDIIEEILFKLNNAYRISIKEVPFTFKKRMFGESKRNLILFIFTYVFTLLKLRFSR